MIEDFFIISETDMDKFAKEVDKVVIDFQGKGLYTEIQFSTTENDSGYRHERIMYSAFITGRTQE